MIGSAVRALAFAFAMTTAALPANADKRLSLTGSYEGGFACDQTNEGAPGGFIATAALDVVQRRSQTIDLEMRFDIPGAGSQVLLFTGEVRTDREREAVSGYIENCGGSFDASEIARILPAAAGADDVTFTADSTFVSLDTPPPLTGQLVVANCRYVFTRTTRKRPSIETCE